MRASSKLADVRDWCNTKLTTLGVGLPGLTLALLVNAADMTTKSDPASAVEMQAFFKREGQVVLTFLGYSAAGYENRAGMLAEAARILDRYPPATTIVNIGGTADGIGAVYALAKGKGYVTSGIVSTQAKQYQVKPSPWVDRVFFIEDDRWGGMLPGTSRLSPTSAAMVEYSNVLVAIGGGEIARDEIRAAKAAGKPVRFIDADMNHKIAIDKAAKAKRATPGSFQSPVREVLEPERSI